MQSQIFSKITTYRLFFRCNSSFALAALQNLEITVRTSRDPVICLHLARKVQK